MLSKLMKTVSRLEEYSNFGIGIVLRSFHNIFYLVYVLNLPVCKSTVYICHTAIFEAGILSFMGLNCQVRVWVQLKLFIGIRLELAPFVKEKKLDI